VNTVLEIHDLTFEDDRLIVEATVEDAVLVRQQTALDPPEWGPAVCRGTLLFGDDTLIPATDSQLRTMLSERIDDWSPLDQSDLYD
jgi:hypothetical protein